jgi:ribosomal protein L37AE/L43A
MSPEIILARLFYTRYCDAVGGKAFNGDPLPDWLTFFFDPEKVIQRDAWVEVGKTAFNLFAEGSKREAESKSLATLTREIIAANGGDDSVIRAMAHGVETQVFAERELVLAVEFLREVCEHAEGLMPLDRDRLRIGMRVGSRVAAKFGKRLGDYQRETFWGEVRALPRQYGICPQCGRDVVEPRDGDHYWEDCGWPEENRPGFDEEDWTQDPPSECGNYWHWSGDPDSAPTPIFVLWSGTSRKCFVTAGQLGLPEAIDCDEFGGWWKRLTAPGTPYVD